MQKKSILVAIISLAVFVQTISSAEIKAIQNGSKIDVTIDNLFFTSYIFSIEEKYPFFFPVNSPASGGSVTSMRNGMYPHPCAMDGSRLWFFFAHSHGLLV